MLVLIARNDQQLISHHVRLDLRQLEVPVQQILAVLFIQAILGKADVPMRRGNLKNLDRIYVPVV